MIRRNTVPQKRGQPQPTTNHFTVQKVCGFDWITTRDSANQLLRIQAGYEYRGWDALLRQLPTHILRNSVCFLLMSHLQTAFIMPNKIIRAASQLWRPCRLSWPSSCTLIHKVHLGASDQPPSEAYKSTPGIFNGSLKSIICGDILHKV